MSTAHLEPVRPRRGPPPAFSGSLAVFVIAAASCCAVPADIQPAETSVALLVGVGADGPIGQPVLARSVREFEDAFRGPLGDGELWTAAHLFFLNGGREAWTVRIAPTGSGVSAAGVASALQAVDRFNILCLPGVTDSAALSAAASACAARGAMLLPDLPRACDSPAAVAQWLAANPGLQSPNVAAYAPWVVLDGAAGVPRMVAPLRPTLRVMPSAREGLRPAARLAAPRMSRRAPTIPACSPAGAVAGLIARIDADRGVWKAPAGVEANLRGVTRLVREPVAGDVDGFAALNVNPLRTLPDGRVVVWGGRTLSTNPEWRYVPVRRTSIFIEHSLSHGTQWAVFEPNDEPLWAQLRMKTSTFMDGLFRSGALQGAKADDAFFVKCDTETTTPTDIANGVCNLIVGFAPLKPAEFVVVRVQLRTATGP